MIIQILNLLPQRKILKNKIRLSKYFEMITIYNIYHYYYYYYYYYYFSTTTPLSVEMESPISTEENLNISTILNTPANRFFN